MIRKENRKGYPELIADLEEKGYKVTYLTLEIGSRGHINRKNKNVIRDMLHKFSGTKLAQKLTKTISKIAVVGSYIIFKSRHEKTWTDLPLLNQ